ncbi:MAG TPA: acyl-CoA dehydrogenase family protein, partial [Steroidobacteraceae bacterium]|nr:acyl-CoA dehydrogenase family protein [Steroidobacteraceae bacterium]
VAWQDQVGQIGLNASSSVACNANGSGHVLQGTKRWVVSAKDVDGWLLDATDQSGLRKIFWLPSDAAGAQIQPYEVIDTYAAYELVLSEVTVDEPIAEGDIATEAIDHAVDIARIAQGAELIGLARASFELTLDYLKTRVQFGKPIGANQALQHRMVDAYVRLEMAYAGVQSAIQKYLANEIPLAEAASWAKSRGADVALMVTRLAVQLHGAIGITDEYQLGQYWKRAHFVSGWLCGPERHSARHLEQHQARELHSESAAKSVDVHACETDFETASIEDFREIVRTFLKQNYPPPLRNPPRRLRLHELKDWLSTLARKGWLAPAWPRQYGGMGLPAAKLIAFVEEFEDFGAARTPDQGIINVGPILIKYGTDEQRRRYLPKILAAEEIWCQGYSEPGAGSDLASLRTRAVLRGDHFCVNGQKIWTTLAHDATHMFMLARTSVEERKHDGISFLLVDLATKGITVRPIRNISGEEEFCEVFLDNVEVPVENLVGEMGAGWKIGMALLGFERLFVGSPKTSQYALTQLKRIGKARGLGNDNHFCSTYGRLLLELLELKAAFAKFSEMAGRGEELPSNVSILKIWATETYTRISAELVRIADEDGAKIGKLHLPGGDDVSPLASLLNAAVTTIYGGSNEIQRNILAKRVLGLPT